MKKLLILCVLFLFIADISIAQNKHDVGFTQSVDVKNYAGAAFKLEGAIKMNSSMDVADAAMWARVHKKDNTIIFFANTIEQSQEKDVWKVHKIEGTIDGAADYLMIGGYCAYNGMFYFDDFKLSVQKDGKWQEFPLENGGFENTNFEKVTLGEKTHDKRMIQGWGGFIVMEDRATFTPMSTSEEVYAGKHALLVKGEGYFYAPAILKKYVGEWDVEFMPDLSHKTMEGAIIKAVMKTEVMGDGHTLNQKWYGRQVIGNQDKIFSDYTHISFHPDLGKLYAVETLEEFPPTIMEGTLEETGSLQLTALKAEGDESRNEEHIYTWLNNDEFSMVHAFDGVSGDRVKIYFKVTRRK